MQWGFAYWKSPWLTYTTPWPGDQGQHQQWRVILTVCTLDATWWKVKVKVAQSCPTLCDQMDYTVHRILQARKLEWVAFHFSRDSSPQGSNPGLLHCRRILYHLSHLKVADYFLLISLFPESLTPVSPWEKHQTNSSRGTFYKISDQYTLKVLKSSKTRKVYINSHSQGDPIET